MASLDIKLERLMEKIAEVGPIVSIEGTEANPVPIYDPEPTPEQETAIAAVIAGFDWSNEADEAWILDKNPERKTLLEQATDAVIRLNQIQNYTPPTMTNVSHVINMLNNQLIPAIKDMALYQEHQIKRLVQIINS